MLSKLELLSIGSIALKQLYIDGVLAWEKPSSYSNQVPISIDTNGSIYNDVGYLNGYRLSSSGGVSARSNGTVTGFIPVKSGDAIRIKGYPWYSTTYSMNYIDIYDSSFTFLYAGNSVGSYSSATIYESVVQDGDITVITLKEISNMAYFRISYYEEDDTVDGANLIITVNEEIS